MDYHFAKRLVERGQAVRDEAFDLTHHVSAAAPPATVKLKAEPKVAQPKLNLADYVSAQAQPPAAVHRSHPEFRFGMLLNDEWGDCGEAMALHGIEAFHLDAGTPVPPFGDHEAEVAYEEVGGFDPSQTKPDGSNPTDQGTDNQVLVDKWRDVGLLDGTGQRHKIAGSLFVDPKDTRLSRIAIWEFVALFRALGLPVTAQGQGAWHLKDPSLQGDAAVGSWGYHDIPYLSYDGRRLRNVSWGADMLVDWDFDTAYAVQGFVVVTTEMLNLRGVSPAGVNWTALNADLAKFPPAPSQ